MSQPVPLARELAKMFRSQSELAWKFRSQSELALWSSPTVWPR